MLIKPIPLSVRKKIGKDVFFRSCCVCGESDSKIDVHHNLTSYENGNRGRTNDYAALLPLCVNCHSQASNKFIKEKLDWIMFSRGLDLRKYPKSNLAQRRAYVETIYGKLPN